MAGRPKEQAVTAALEQLARDEISDDATALEWICMQCAAGKTLQELSEILAPHCGFTPSEGWLPLVFSRLAPDAKDRIREARTMSGEVLVGRARRTLETASTETREDFQKAKSLSDLDLWLAARRDRENLGDAKSDTNINFNLGALHLEALRAVQPRRPAPVLTVEPGGAADAPALPSGDAA